MGFLREIDHGGRLISVWLTIPSARPASEIKERLERWRDMGYKIALWRNGPHVDDSIECDWLFSRPDYHGWGASINFIIERVAEYDPTADWFLGGGDDTDPDPTKRAEDIAQECSEHFYDEVLEIWQSLPVSERRATPAFARWFGVMQPTGDRWGADEPWAKAMFPDAPAYIDRICGSPWIGRSFAERAHSGAGPFHPDFFHMFADESLLEYAKMLGVLWQRRDLIHFHDHPRRDGIPRTPDFAAATGIYGSEEWERGKAILARLKAEKFASCLPK